MVLIPDDNAVHAAEINAAVSVENTNFEHPVEVVH
jgi:hypothetical protein